MFSVLCGRMNVSFHGESAEKQGQVLIFLHRLPGTCQVELLLLPCRLRGGMQGRGGRGAAGQGRRRGGGCGGGGGRGIAAGVRLVRHRDVILGGDRSCA